MVACGETPCIFLIIFVQHSFSVKFIYQISCFSTNFTKVLKKCYCTIFTCLSFFLVSYLTVCLIILINNKLFEKLTYFLLFTKETFRNRYPLSFYVYTGSFPFISRFPSIKSSKDICMYATYLFCYHERKDRNNGGNWTAG